MNKVFIFVGLLSAAILIVGLVYMSGGLRREFERSVKKALAIDPGYEKKILTGEDISHLPRSVQKYLTYVGVIGKERVLNVKIIGDGIMKMEKKSGWAKIRLEQFNFFGMHLIRLFYIDLQILGIHIYGLHVYNSECARMVGKLAGLIKVLKVGSREMRISDTVTLFNDMCIFAPATLIDERISWEELDESTVKATFKTDYCEVSAVLHFNENSQLVNFISEDRYYVENDGSFQKFRWSTPITRYEAIGNFNLFAKGDVVWNLPEGDYCYMKVTKVKEISYNYLAKPE